MIATVKKTKEYLRFNRLPGNRLLNMSKVRQLVESIRERNQLEYFPIIVNEHFEVIDGQHRLKAAELLEVDIFFEVRSMTSLADAQRWNTNIHAWNNMDFLNSYIERGFDDYEVVKNFITQFHFPLALSIMLLGGGSLGHGEMLVFKKGGFKVANVNQAISMAERLTELRPYVEENVWTNREFVAALFKVYKRVSQKLLLQKLQLWQKNGKPKIVKHGHLRDYVRDIEDIVNYHSVHPISISFK